MGYGNLISERRVSGGTPTSSYYHFDALGSTDRLTDSTQNVVKEVTYKAFGGIVADSGGPATNFLFVGRLGYYYDRDLGTYDIRERPYEPVTGRWLSFERLFSLLTSLFTYVDNQPSDSVDPSGFWRIVGTIMQPYYSYIFKREAGDSGPPCLAQGPKGAFEVRCPPPRPNDPDGPSYQQGIRGLLAGLQLLIDKCKKCCTPRCTREQCEDSAHWIIFRLVTAWQNNYYRGPYNPSGDPVGGFLCWDWAKIFHEALKNESNDCFETHEWAARSNVVTQDGELIHYYLWVYVGRRTTECSVMFDDGFFGGGILSHDGPSDFEVNGWTIENPARIPPPPELRDCPFNPIEF